MSSPFDIIQANNINEISFIAGDKQVLNFDIYDSASAAVNITSASAQWTLSRFGDPSVANLVKSGTISGSPTNRFTVTLTYNDTYNLSGIFIQQPILTDILGDIYHPGQGKVTIFPFVPTS